eukprot:TRINITY_DN12_c0_g1_i1.p1 TRINITY_DN12_c0_g1~~TRINITY_DN12_c0_g1_i1.p1  ORF type:complete len:388 (+),score=71.71 TRINITY_DN12_c0_g1_i1:38-1201(+)
MSQQQTPNDFPILDNDTPNSFNFPMQQQQQASFNFNNAYGGNAYGGNAYGGNAYGGFGGEPTRRIEHGEVDKSLPLMAVIVSLCEGSSYDPLFVDVPQDVPDGRVSVFRMRYADIALFLDKMEGNEVDSEIIDEIWADVQAVDADAVVFNWECCSSCSGKTFGGEAESVFLLAKAMIDRGSMIMFSDFALKALVAEWDEGTLGPNPFVNVGETTDAVVLQFDTNALAECPSAQLQKVGELCDNGSATVHCLSSTIVLGFDAVKADTTAYSAEVLTVATKVPNFSIEEHESNMCKIGDHVGAPAHVLLTYPSGGLLLVASCHWIELVKLDVSIDSLLKVAEATYGGAYQLSLKSELEALTGDEQYEKMQMYSRQMVQQSAPCKYSKKF